jgi:hypothetical protein
MAPGRSIWRWRSSSTRGRRLHAADSAGRPRRHRTPARAQNTPAPRLVPEFAGVETARRRHMRLNSISKLLAVAILHSRLAPHDLIQKLNRPSNKNKKITACKVGCCEPAQVQWNRAWSVAVRLGGSTRLQNKRAWSVAVRLGGSTRVQNNLFCTQGV